MSIFTNKKVNCGRQREIDYLRGITAIYLIIVHVGLYLGGSASKGLYTFCDILGSEFGAPIFMGLMGISAVFSRHQAPKLLLKRGICLFVTGYALSFYRSIIPMLVWGSIDEWATLEAFFVVDILQFAGLSFMFLALLKKFKLSNIVVFVISVVMVIIDQFIMLPASVPWNSKILTGIVNLFCPITEWSCFPFLTWFFFPAFGLVLGDALKHCINKKRLYAVMLPIGLVGILYVYYRFYCLYPDYTCYYYGHNFYYMGLKNVLLTACFIGFSIAFWFFADKIMPDFIKKFLNFLSKNLNPFYIFSWLVISVLIHLQTIYSWKLNTVAVLVITLLTEIICVILTKLWLIIKGTICEKDKNTTTDLIVKG